MSLIKNIKERNSSHSGQKAGLQVEPRQDPLSGDGPQEDNTQPAVPAKTIAEQVKNLETQLSDLPTTSRLGLRLEQGIRDRIQEYCRENSITPETHIEALFVECMENGNMQKVKIDASERLALRRQAGEIRKLITRLNGLS